MLADAVLLGGGRSTGETRATRPESPDARTDVAGVVQTPLLRPAVAIRPDTPPSRRSASRERLSAAPLPPS